jgi:DNA-binding transcriptional ArsR family regulator
MTLPHEPELADVPLTTVMQALSDDVRLRIVRELAAGGEQICGTFELDVSKATRSHHFRVLREAGLTRTRVDGTRRYVSLRADDVGERFPGLLDAVLGARV